MRLLPAALLFLACNAFAAELAGVQVSETAQVEARSLVLNGADDAIKNYFGTLWAVRYDSGYWFTGANYPVGEHLV